MMVQAALLLNTRRHRRFQRRSFLTRADFCGMCRRRWRWWRAESRVSRENQACEAESVSLFEDLRFWDTGFQRDSRKSVSPFRVLRFWDTPFRLGQLKSVSLFRVLRFWDTHFRLKPVKSVFLFYVLRFRDTLFAF